MDKIRVRYAPSPTGQLHIGNARTALFNYLFAKHLNGKFIIRIEDTDIVRNVKGAEKAQFDELKWLGIIPDESILNPGDYGPYNQLNRLEIYNKYASELLRDKKAYNCFCEAEKLEASRLEQLNEGIKSPKYDRTCLKLNSEEVLRKIKSGLKPNIRFRVSDNEKYNFHDLVRGSIDIESKDIGDWIILKSNGIPTYNFAAAIDDVMMKISHVIRGEEHISNTPKQLMICESFGWKAPTYCHLTLIVNENRQKLSKRDNNVMQFISQYRENGYLPEVLFNFICLLGWSPNNEKEIFCKEELVKIFDPKRFSKSPSMFDIKKLQWMNGEYFKKMDENIFINFIYQFISEDIKTQKNSDWLETFFLTYKREISYGKEINLFLDKYINNSNLDFEHNALLGIDVNDKLESKLLLSIIEMQDFKIENIQLAIKTISEELNIKGKKLFMPIRVMASRIASGPELAKVIYLLGKEQVILNIREFSNRQCKD